MPQSQSHLAPYLLALALLIGAVALLLRLFTRQLADWPPWVRLTLAATTAGGVIGAPFWWAGIPGSFAWTPAPLAFRFLAVAGLAFATVGVQVMARPESPRLRALMAMLTLYLVPLVGVILILHADRLDWQAPVVWGFVTIAGGLGLAALAGLARIPVARPGPASPQRWLWTVAAALFLLWGLALFAWPAGPVAALWLWPADALTSRLIGAMLLTIGLMAALAARRADLAGLMASGIAVYGLGVALACLLHAAAGRPLPWAYLGTLGIAGALAALRTLRR